MRRNNDFADRGVDLRTVQAPDTAGSRGEAWNEALLDSIDSSTSVVALPHYHWMDGTRFDLAAAGERARAVGAALRMQEALADLNERLDVPLSMDRFRANLVIDGTPAWAEDDWTPVDLRAEAIDDYVVERDTTIGMRPVDAPIGYKAMFWGEDPDRFIIQAGFWWGKLEGPIKFENDTVLGLYRLFASEDEMAEIEEAYRTGSIGYGDAKKRLLAKVDETFAPARERRAELLKDPSIVDDVLADGARRAREVARDVVARCREATGMLGRPV